MNLPSWLKPAAGALFLGGFGSLLGGGAQSTPSQQSEADPTNRLLPAQPGHDGVSNGGLGTAPSPWNPSPPDQLDPLLPHIQDTRDLKYLNDPSILGRLDEIHPGESLSEVAKRIKSRVWGKNGAELTDPAQPPTFENQSQNTTPSGEINSPPFRFDASKLLPKKATPEDRAMLQEFLDRHPELMSEEIRPGATTPFGKRETWELLRTMRINPEALQLPDWRDTDKMRREPGVAVGGETLPNTDYLFQPLDNQGKQRAPIGLIPGQIARQLRGKDFKNFDEFRATFWKLVAQDSKLSQGWEDPENLKRMKEGKAPYAPRNGRTGKEISYQLDHSDDLQYGGGVYDMDSIRIVTPRFHDEYGN
ncbi:hypothetical protein [Leptolyngbya sp. FACHB-17]|uniref:hypothetical protein n=1 Tax=unclassified Leptolyngbya TaxID=2650499 RepID=UPI0019BF9C09|nr:hypothetical protein [Leptolyngbya sp. FACHB-17]MBD2080440.1 hypothetical protein [Leptolyngbya sp. FACHB-17]